MVRMGRQVADGLIEVRGAAGEVSDAGGPDGGAAPLKRNRIRTPYRRSLPLSFSIAP